MSTRRTQPVVGGQIASVTQYNYLRAEALGSAYLLGYSQSSIKLSVNLANIFFGSSFIEFAGGDSPSFTVPSTNNRIDLLCLGSTGALEIIWGTESATPTPPYRRADKVIIAQVYNRTTQTMILDEDTAPNTQGYIQKDFRHFLKLDLQPTVRVITANTTWYKPEFLKYIEVEAVGPGQIGGTGVTSTNSGGGGGGGGYAKSILTASDLSGTTTIGIKIGQPNSVQELTKFGSFITAEGGSQASATRPGGGGTASGGNILNIRGQSGTPGIFTPGTDDSGGIGASSPMGSGGRGGKSGAVGAQAGDGKGAGGGGGHSNGESGGSGTAGAVIVKEYF